MRTKVVPLVLFLTLLLAGCKDMFHSEGPDWSDGSIPTLIGPALQGLHITGRTEDSICLSWEELSGAGSYKVYKGSSSNAVNEYVAETASATYTVTGLAANTSYYFTASVVGENGEYQPSAAVQGKTLEMAAFDQDYTVYSDADFTEAVAGINASPAQGIYRITLSSSISANNISFSTTSVEKTIIIKAGANPRTISNTDDANLFTINSGNTLVLENNVRLDGNAKTGNAVSIYNGGNLVMKDGSRIEGAGDSGVYIFDGGTFTMSGGVISGNTASNNNTYGSGGGVNITYGKFMMSGGVISGNTASNNNTYGNGGGVYFFSGAFTMSGGVISGNTASNNNTYGSGGGVYFSGGAFTMSGGVISGNTASYGGGVHVSKRSTFAMSDGVISGNTASYGGGGVYISDGTFTMSGGGISGNTAFSNSGSFSDGGGVYVFSGMFTMSDGEISGNTASSGGGVYVSDSTFTKSGGGTIYGSDASNTLKNTAGNGFGHAVYFNYSAKRDMTAGPSVDMDTNKTGAAGGWE
jgi:hypothetical protein